MIKLIFFLLIILFLSYIGLFLVNNNVAISFDWFGYQVETTILFIILAAFLANFIIFFIIAKFFNIIEIINQIRKNFLIKKYQNNFKNIEQAIFFSNIGDDGNFEKTAGKIIKVNKTEYLNFLLKSEIAFKKGSYDTALAYTHKISDKKIARFMRNKIKFRKSLEVKDYENASYFLSFLVKDYPNANFVLNELLLLDKYDIDISEQKNLLKVVGEIDVAKKSQTANSYKEKLGNIYISIITDQGNSKFGIEDKVEACQYIAKHDTDLLNLELLNKMTEILTKNGYYKQASDLVVNYYYKNLNNKDVIDIYVKYLRRCKEMEVGLQTMIKYSPDNYELHLEIIDYYLNQDFDLKKAKNYLVKARDLGNSDRLKELSSIIEKKINDDRYYAENKSVLTKIKDLWKIKIL